MKAYQSISTRLDRLWRHISNRRRWHFRLLLVLMILVSFAEVLSIGAVLPFLGVLTAPSRVFEHPAAQPLIRTLGISSTDQLLLVFTIGFGLAALIAGAMRLLLIWATMRLSYATGADLSINVYRRTLYQPYAVHIARNSSEVINGISNKSYGVIQIIMGALSLISASVMLVAILIALLFVDPIVALLAFGGFGLIYVFIILIARKRLSVDSRRIARESTQVIKSLQEGLGSIRDILLDGSQAIYCQIYRDADRPMRRAQANKHIVSASPRFGMEAFGMILIATLAYTLAQGPDGIARGIPVLGAMALGAQRFLPVLQQAYAAWTEILSGQASLQDTLDLLDQPLPEHADSPRAESLTYFQGISLNQVSFRYRDDTPWVLRNLNLTIPKGSRIGIIGTTGSGKSTLVDIIMVLLQPTGGMLAIDGQAITSRNHRAWQAHIAHVPQVIFLADTAIEENIAFGVPRDQINHERVRHAADQAQIADLIESWPQKYQTFVGERGIRLSGGQRQRIGIARALYKQADVIIFDEATSALDSDTERSVMQSLEGLSSDLTILIIAHRLTTLRYCDQIVELGNGGVIRTGSYESMINQPTRLNEA